MQNPTAARLGTPPPGLRQSPDEEDQARLSITSPLLLLSALLAALPYND